MIRTILFWLLFPFVLPQGFLLRKNAPKVTGAGGDNNGTYGSGPRFSLVGVGDSIITGVGVSRLEDAFVSQTAQKLSAALTCRIDWRVCGKTGIHSGGIIKELLPQLSDSEADFILLSVGVNDITSIRGVSEWKRNLDKILRTLSTHSPRAIIAVSGIPPMGKFPLLPQPLRTLFGLRSRTFDLACRQVVSTHPSVIYVPIEFKPQPDMFSPDGYHPSKKSYREFSNLTARLILDQLELKQNESE